MATLSFPPPQEPRCRILPALRHGFVVQCAESVRGQQSLVRSYRFLLVGASLSVLTLTATGGFLIATRALRPVQEVSGDRALLTEVFVNLIDNAVKYNVPMGKVSVSLGTNSDEAIVVISDTGIGIPREDVHKVFERFYRVDPSRSRKSGGAGLGLSIAREIVKLHGGRIEIQSTPGAGSRVCVRLPAASLVESTDGETQTGARKPGLDIPLNPR